MLVMKWPKDIGVISMLDTKNKDELVVPIEERLNVVALVVGIWILPMKVLMSM